MVLWQRWLMARDTGASRHDVAHFEAERAVEYVRGSVATTASKPLTSMEGGAGAGAPLADASCKRVAMDLMPCRPQAGHGAETVADSGIGAKQLGPYNMRMMSKNGLIAAAAMCAASALTAAPVTAQQKELSEASIEKLMDYAWQITPERFTKPNGVTVEIGNDRKIAEVPLEAAREIIRVSRLSAHAQVCDLKDEHATNYRTMMAREAIKKKWSEQQMVFINQLHLVTVMMLTGRAKLIEQEDGKEPKVVEETSQDKFKATTCTTEERNKVRDAVTAYLKSGPQLAPADTAAGGPAPAAPVAPAATPASATKAAPSKK